MAVVHKRNKVAEAQEFLNSDVAKSHGLRIMKWDGKKVLAWDSRRQKWTIDDCFRGGPLWEGFVRLAFYFQRKKPFQVSI